MIPLIDQGGPPTHLLLGCSLIAVGIFSLLLIAFLLWSLIPDHGLLRGIDDNDILRSPFAMALRNSD